MPQGLVNTTLAFPGAHALSGFGTNLNTFNPDPTGNTDSTAAIQNAIAATPAGGTLIVPGGFYVISGSGTEIFLRRTPIKIIGVGNPVFIVASSVPSTRNILRLAPTSITYGWQVSGLLVQGNGGNFGQHVIYIDTLASGSGMYASLFSDNIINPTASGKSIYLNNSQATGGLFNSVIERNTVESIYLPNCGDLIRVANNTLNNSNAGAPFNSGIYGYNVSGAANTKIIGNSIAVLTGHIFWEGGVNLIVRDNEFETPAGVTNVAGYVIKIDSAGGANWAPQILNNSFAVLAGTSNPTPIVIGSGVTNAMIQGGRIGVISGSHINVQAGAVATHIDGWSIQPVTNNVVGSLTVTDSGTGTLTR